MKSEGRIEWLDYLKAFACFLVVLGHLLMSFQVANIYNSGLMNFIIFFIYLFHMPLFMCISGYLYCKFKKISIIDQYKNFEKKKILNLAIPYFTFYLLFLAISFIFKDSVNTPKGLEELIGIINNPMAPYWFLYSLLTIFLLIPLLEMLFKRNDKAILIFLFILKIYKY